MKFEQIIEVARNGTCAFNLEETARLFKLSSEEVLKMLAQRGFKFIGKIEPSSIIQNFRNRYVGQSSYKRGSSLGEEPQSFNCSSFAVHLYEQIGIWLPRISIAQSYYWVGKDVSVYDLKPLDLLFTKSEHRNRYIDDPSEAIGHVLIYTGKECHTVIHAANKAKGVIEERAEKYLLSKNLQQIKRIIYNPEKWILLKIPENIEIESSDDIFWKLAYDHELKNNLLEP